MKKYYSLFLDRAALVLVGILWMSLSAHAGVLGSAGSYSVLAGQTITNTGATSVTGDIGVSPGTVITGFGTVSVTGCIYLGDSTAATSIADLDTAYTNLSALSAGTVTDLTGQNLGGLALPPGVYIFNSSAQLTGTLTLDAENNPNARFVFIISSTLTTGANSAVNIINISTSKEGADCGIFWVVGSSATIQADCSFAGNILAKTSVTLSTGASISHGRALARNGSVTLDTNEIDASDVNGGFGAVTGPVIYTSLSFDVTNAMSWDLSTVNGSVSGVPLLDAKSMTLSEGVVFSIMTDSDFGTANVLFTDPTGLALNNTTAMSGEANGGLYDYTVEGLPAYLRNGIYGVVCDSIDYTWNVDDAPAAGANVILAPVITQADSIIQSISWTAYRAGDVSTAVDISLDNALVSIQLADSKGNVLYERADFSPGITSADVHLNDISIYDVASLILTYRGSPNVAGVRYPYFSSYGVSVNETANIFQPLAHVYGEWIEPATATVDSYGTLWDGSFPFVYNASEDALANNGTYLGNGNGWTYILKGGCLRDGFYVYRYATGTWAWTNYNWGGWIYDYGTKGVGAGWIDITPKST
jgi:hypothetical protein